MNETDHRMPQGHTPQSHKTFFKKQPYGSVSKPQENLVEQSAPAEGTPAEVSRREKGYKKLIAWQRADELAFLIYKATESFPRDETYGVRSQMRRAALSVPTNLVEGNGRQNRKEFKQYVNIALGSLSEIEYLLDFALKLGYVGSEQHRAIFETRDQVGGLLWKLYKSIDD
ncbi:MAG: four helix bundle protein [Candidatus Omnitrophica bacterium]|nr:four helix bundle protein [Candidatus Omnitrophota bacterium]